MKTALRRKLNSLWLGELVAAVVFIFAFFGARDTWGTEIVGNFALLGLTVLSVILLQGSGYWCLKLRHLNDPHFSLDPRLLRLVYIFNLVLLLAFPAALTVTVVNGSIEDSLSDVAVSIGLYLFALVEFAHYFLVKLVHSDDDQRARTQRRQVTARLMRELQRGEARKDAHERSS